MRRLWNIRLSDEIKVRWISISFMVNMKTRILFVDDHDLFRETLKKFINERQDMTISAEANNRQEACSLVRTSDFDLVLLDIGLQARNGLGIINEIKNKKPYLPVLICSLLPEEYFGPAAIRAGASGYVMKDRMPNDIINAIQQVAMGGIYFGNGKH
jgi:two-component system, NarL family, invasion response regulator UvrY